MKAAIEQVFNGSLPQVAIGGAYDATKINRGKHTGQYNLGSDVRDKFVGPAPVGIANFGESPLGIMSNFVYTLKITDDLFWIFGQDSATAAATRRVQLWTFQPSTNTHTFRGAVTLTFPTTTAHTNVGLSAALTNYTTGTIEVNGTSVTGTGTSWLTGLSVGSRIGFGSANPQAIVTWYQIASINSDTSITLTSSAGTIASGTAYVIQDLMLVLTNRNATVTSGGLFVAKGLRFEDFTNPSTTIPAATTIDKIKAVYWLKDAATITNDVPSGLVIDEAVSLTQQFAYVGEGSATTLQIYRYNIRTPLTLTAGAHTLTGTDIVVTGAQTVTGTILANQSLKIATLQHGSASGVKSLFLLTQTRLVRIPVSNVVNGNVLFVADSMSEVPPGGTNTNSLSGATPFASFDIASSIDKVVIVTAASVSSSIYVTDYYSGGQQLDRRMSCGTGQFPSALRDTGSPIYLHYTSTGSPAVFVEDGWLFYLFGTGQTTTTNTVVSYPLAADLSYQSDVNNRVICPKIVIGDVIQKLYRVCVNEVTNLGDHILGVSPDAYYLQVRTSGIDDNSGVWTDVPQDGDLSGLGVSNNIQFAFTFRTAGVINLPSRILSLALIYETEDALPSQYRWNFADFNQNNGTFAWVQAALFGISLTTHTIEIYRADTNALVLTQASTGTTNGTFEYWNGSAWIAGLGTDTLNTRRRFVPSGSLPSGVDLYAKILVS